MAVANFVVLKNGLSFSDTSLDYYSEFMLFLTLLISSCMKGQKGYLSSRFTKKIIHEFKAASSP